MCVDGVDSSLTGQATAARWHSGVPASAALEPPYTAQRYTHARARPVDSRDSDQLFTTPRQLNHGH